MNTPTKTSIELPEIMKSTHNSTTDDDALHSPPTSLVISTSYLADDYVSVDSSVSASPLSLTEEKENQVQVPHAPRNLYAGLLSPSNKPRHSQIGTLTKKFVAKAPSPLAEVKPNRNEQRAPPYASRVLRRPDVAGGSWFSPSPRRWPFDEQTQVHVAKKASPPAVPHILAMEHDGSDTSSLENYKSENESVDTSIAGDDAFSHSSSSAGLSYSADGVSIADHESTDASNASFSDEESTPSVDDADDGAPMTTDKSTQMTRPHILQPFVKKEFSGDDESLKYSSSPDGLSNKLLSVSGVEHGRTDASYATFLDDPSTPPVDDADDSPTPFVEPVENCIADKSTQMSRPNIDQGPVNSASTIKKELGYDSEDLDDPIDEVVMADNSTQMARPLIPQPIKEELSDDDEALKSIIIGSNGIVSVAADASIQANLLLASDVAGLGPRNDIYAAYFKLDYDNQKLEKENLNLRSNTEEMNSRNDVLVKEVGTIKAESDVLAGHACSLQDLQSKLMLEKAQLEQKLKESRGCNDALTSENASLKSNLVRTGIQRDALDDILIKHVVEMQAFEQEKAVLEIKLDTMRRKAEELNGVVNNQSEEKERLEEECMSHKVELTRLEMEKDGMKVELYFANQKEAEFADNVSKLTREKAQLEKQCDALAISLGKCNDEIETLKKENTIPFEVANGVGDSYDSAVDDDGDESCSYNTASEISGWSGWEALQADYRKLEKELGDATKKNEQLQAMVDLDNATTLLDLQNEKKELQEIVKMMSTNNIQLTDHIEVYRSLFVEDDGSMEDTDTSVYKHRARLMHEIEVTDKVIQDHESRIQTL